MLPKFADDGPPINFGHLGFENFDWWFLAVMAGRMGIAALLGAIVAYRPWRRLIGGHFERPESGAQVLIAVAGGLMTGVIYNNVALAFALVGLGGFIRFRSGIKDPREAGVMFLMIGIGMSSGVGAMPIALTATVFGVILLTALDLADRNRTGRVGRRRIVLRAVGDPRQVESVVCAALAQSARVIGSRVALAEREVGVDIYGDKIQSAGQVFEILSAAGIEFEGDISIEEIR